MNIDYQDLGADLRQVTLAGRLDIAGTDAISTRYSALTGASGRGIVVDLSGVSFLGSIGIRMLLSSAKATQQRGGRTVLLIVDNPAVNRTLEVAGITTLMPVYAMLAEALAAARA